MSYNVICNTRVNPKHIVLKHTENTPFYIYTGNLGREERIEKTLRRDYYKKNSKFTNKNNLKNSKKICEEFLGRIENYCENTTLHGLKYIGNSSLSIIERIFWFVAFLSAIMFATYYITHIYKKWNSNPVIISNSPFNVGLKFFPFPSVTLCNMNQAKKSEAQRIIHEGSDDERKLLDIVCKADNFNYSNDTTPKWDIIKNFMVKVGQSCNDMLKECRWKGDKVSCDDLFDNYLTDEGICCSFNSVTPSFMFRNKSNVGILNQTFPLNAYDWQPQFGFSDDYNESFTPQRAAGAGAHLGLTVILDAEVDNYYCSSTFSTGFKILLANPVEYPKITDFSSLMAPGQEARFEIHPEITRPTLDLKKISIKNRQCFFPDERPLFYYRTYTQNNCKIECQSNYTYKLCGCIPYYLPRLSSMEICGVFEGDCITQANEDMNILDNNGTDCHCLPSCFRINFRKTVSTTRLSPKENKLNITPNYFSRNMAVLNFFFKESNFPIKIKSELYGSTEILSNIGGLLGLFMGFSFLSLIEVIYYLSLKVCCEVIQTKRKQYTKIRNLNNQTFNNTSLSCNIQPFIN